MGEHDELVYEKLDSWLVNRGVLLIIKKFKVFAAFFVVFGIINFFLLYRCCCPRKATKKAKKD